MPPAIGVVGVSGGGKSSTVNALFGTDLSVSHTTAGTAGFGDVGLARLQAIDAPGPGEDRDQDRSLLRQYRERRPECDVVLWVLTARHRGLALDQSYLDRLPDLSDRLVFGVNQVDLIAPGDWDRAVNLPSDRQEQHMLEILEDRKARLRLVGLLACCGRVGRRGVRDDLGQERGAGSRTHGNADVRALAHAQMRTLVLQRHLGSGADLRW
jgi:predicted GTPase